MLRSADGLRLGGVQREGTVMFSDLRGFTSFAETLQPAQVIDALNRYLTEMSEAILDHGGTLVAYMGDGIMAVFGAPLQQPDHADRALAAARDMLERLEGFNQWLRDTDMHDGFKMGIGLNTGPVMSGHVGSERRLEYTALGDTTNTAARLEGMTKGTPYQLYVADSTREALRTPADDLVEVGEFEVRGRKATIKLWSLAGRSTVSERQRLSRATAGRRRRADFPLELRTGDLTPVLRPSARLALARHPDPCLRLQQTARGGRRDVHGELTYHREDDVVSQVLEPTGDAGKTYTLASWLPTLRVSGNARPQTTLREDAITAFLGAYTLVALFWDGLRHNNLTGVDNFFSPAAHRHVPGPDRHRRVDRDRPAALPEGPRRPRLVRRPARLRARLRGAAAGGDRRPARLHLARGVRLREPDRLDLQPAAPGPLLLRRDAGRDPRRLGLAAPRGARPRCASSCPWSSR